MPVTIADKLKIRKRTQITVNIFNIFYVDFGFFKLTDFLRKRLLLAVYLFDSLIKLINKGIDSIVVDAEEIDED